MSDFLVISSKSDFQAVVTHKNYKMIWGQEFLLDRAQHLQSDNVQLYDIDKDPEERNNIQHLNDEVCIYVCGQDV